jgi:hypothetical protein
MLVPRFMALQCSCQAGGVESRMPYLIECNRFKLKYRAQAVMCKYYNIVLYDFMDFIYV